MIRSRKTLTLLSVLALTACVQQVEPVWEAYFSTVDNNNNIEWLKRTELDSSGDVIIAGSSLVAGPNRNEDGLLVKYDAFGNLIWTTKLDQSQDHMVQEKFTDLAVFGSDIYVAGQFWKNDPVFEEGSFVAKYNQDGKLIWLTPVSAESDLRDIEVSDSGIYVTGYQTQRLNDQGEITLSVPHAENAWDVEVDEIGNIYVGSRYGVEKLDSEGATLWKTYYEQSKAESVYFNVNIELSSEGKIAWAANDQSNVTSSAQLLSQTGDRIWTKSIAKSENVSLQGTPQITFINHDVLISVSSDESRVVTKYSDSGRQLWQFNDALGPVHEMGVLDNGYIVLTGGGNTALLAEDGTQLAEHNVNRYAQNLTGSLAIDQNDVYVATTVSVSGSGLQGYLAKFSQ